MSNSDNDIGSEAILAVLNQIDRSVNKLADRVQESEKTTSETVIRLEERAADTHRLEERIEKLEGQQTERLNNHSTRLNILEASKHRIEGAGMAAGLAAKVWPIVTTLIGAGAAYLGFRAI